MPRHEFSVYEFNGEGDDSTDPAQDEEDEGDDEVTEMVDKFVDCLKTNSEFTGAIGARVAHSIETSLQDGSIRVTVHVGGAA